MPDLSSSWRFGDVDVHPDLNTVVRDGVETPVPPRVMEVLVRLIEHRETVVTTEELLQTYWPGRIVEESTLHRLVSQMRQALGDSARSPKYIRTVSKRGYQALRRRKCCRERFLRLQMIRSLRNPMRRLRRLHRKVCRLRRRASRSLRCGAGWCRLWLRHLSLSWARPGC